MSEIDVFWNALGTVGLEHLHFSTSEKGQQADGVVLRHHNGEALRIHYQVRADADWRTREVRVSPLGAAGSQIHLVGDGEGAWRNSKKQALEALNGCLDVDIMATPFTNTLAIKRLGLKPGQSADLDVAYVVIPQFEVRRGRQRYSCLARAEHESRYLYESLESDFQAELRVDEADLVIDYEGIWERLYPGSP